MKNNLGYDIKITTDEQFLNELKVDRFAILYTSDYLRNDTSLMLKAIEFDDNNFRYVDDSLKNYIYFLIKAMEANPFIEDYISKEMKLEIQNRIKTMGEMDVDDEAIKQVLKEPTHLLFIDITIDRNFEFAKECFIYDTYLKCLIANYKDRAGDYPEDFSFEYKDGKIILITNDPKLNEIYSKMLEKGWWIDVPKVEAAMNYNKYNDIDYMMNEVLFHPSSLVHSSKSNDLEFVMKLVEANEKTILFVSDELKNIYGSDASEFLENAKAELSENKSVAQSKRLREAKD